MPLGHEILDTLACPVAKTPLRVMTPEEVRELNEAIADGRSKYAGGGPVAEPLEGGLVTVDGASAYAIREGVPALLPSRRIVRGDAPTEAPAPRIPGEQMWTDFWETISLRWQHRTPPSRPAPEDVAVLEPLVAEGLAGSQTPRALLLGVTPEIAAMRWPVGTRLLAIDASPGMIRNVWPAPAVPHATAVLGDWTALPVRAAAFDAVVGDAALGIQEYPQPFFGVLREVRRALKDGGLLAARVFTRPERNETLEAIFADLHAGRIASLDFFRWRLAAALHGGRGEGTRQGRMWDAWAANVPDPAGLVRTLGWPEATLAVMENARGSAIPMVFPTLREYREDLAGAFVETACEFPAYPDGDRYPTLAFRSRPR